MQREKVTGEEIPLPLTKKLKSKKDFKIKLFRKKKKSKIENMKKASHGIDKKKSIEQV